MSKLICRLFGHISGQAKDWGTYREWRCSRCGRVSYTTTITTRLSQPSATSRKSKVTSKKATK